MTERKKQAGVFIWGLLFLACLVLSVWAVAQGSRQDGTEASTESPLAEVPEEAEEPPEAEGQDTAENGSGQTSGDTEDMPSGVIH